MAGSSAELSYSSFTVQPDNRHNAVETFPTEGVKISPLKLIVMVSTFFPS